MRRAARWPGLAFALALIASQALAQGRAADDAAPDDAKARMAQARRTAESPLRWITESAAVPVAAPARAAAAPAAVRPTAIVRPRPVAKSETPAVVPRVDADAETASSTTVVVAPAPVVAAADAVIATVPAWSAPATHERGRLVLKTSPGPALRPSECLMNSCAGTVRVAYTVEADGSVSHPRLLHPTANERFNARVIEAVTQWRYEPIDAPVESQVALRIVRD